MQSFSINSPGIIFRSKEYGKRLLFKLGQVNPRNQMGKLGINYHNPFMALFYKTIKVQITVTFHDAGVLKLKTQTLHLNRNSALKYVRAHNKTFHMVNPSDVAIISALNACFLKTSDLDKIREISVMKQQSQWGENGLTHAGDHNKRRLHGFFQNIRDRLRGRFLSWLYHKAVSGLLWLKARFLYSHTEKDYFDDSEILAKKRFNEAAETVPAYKQHLEKNQFHSRKDATFFDIPLTSKDNYIKPHAAKGMDHLTHTYGQLPQNGKIDTSTGTTGAPTTWHRSNKEIETVIKSMLIIGKLEYGHRPLHTINAFALGPWATGLSVHEMMRKEGGGFSVGADKNKILENLEYIYRYEQARIESTVSSWSKKTLHYKFHDAKQISEIEKQLRTIIITTLNLCLQNPKTNIEATLTALWQQNKADHNFKCCEKHILKLSAFHSVIKSMIDKLNSEKRQIFVCGYPPFMIELLKHAKSKKIDFKKYHAICLVGGQAISEATRQLLLDGGFMAVRSSYGASDLDINLATEDAFTVALRKQIEAHPGLARELYGANKGSATIGTYDPMNYLIESLPGEKLVFTCNRDNRSSPRIRYALGDTGRVYASSDIQAMLEKHGIFNLKPRTNLPLIFLWGRDSTAVFNLVSVSHTELEQAITEVGLQNDWLKRALYKTSAENGTDRFDIIIELNDDVPMPSTEALKATHMKLLNALCKVNEYFKFELAQLPENEKLPTLHVFKRRNPNSPISEPDGLRKQVLVFNKGQIQFPDNDNDYISSTLVNDAAFQNSLTQNTGLPALN